MTDKWCFDAWKKVIESMNNNICPKKIVVNKNYIDYSEYWDYWNVYFDTTDPNIISDIWKLSFYLQIDWIHNLSSYIVASMLEDSEIETERLKKRMEYL